LPSPILNPEAMKGTRAFLVALGLLALGLGLYTWASPYLFLRGLRGAVLEGDRARLERMVDFPRVREGLKAQIHARLLEEVGKELQANTLCCRFLRTRGLARKLGKGFTGAPSLAQAKLGWFTGAPILA